jgi:hypothetical protein
MEVLAGTSTDIIWTTNGTTQTNPLTGTTGATVINTGAATHCVFSAVCDWNLIMMSSFDAIPNQCYSMQTALNV